MTNCGSGLNGLYNPTVVTEELKNSQLNVAQQQDAVVNEQTSGQEKAKKSKKKRGPMARFLRCICWLLLSPVILFVVLTVLLYVPFVQDWVTEVACEKLSEATGLDVKVERLRVKFPLDVDLQRVCVREVTTGDTLLAVRSCVLDLDMSRIFSWEVGVDAFDLSDAVVDSRDLIASFKLRGRLNTFHLDAHQLELKKGRANITSARLDGCDIDIALQDTTLIDTTTSTPLMWMLDFHDIQLHHIHVAFHTAQDTMSILAGVKSMSLDDGGFNIGRNNLSLNNFYIEADSVTYDMNYMPRQLGLDVNHLSFHNLALDLPCLLADLSSLHLRTTLASLQAKEVKSGLELRQLSAEVELDTTQLKVSRAVLRTPGSQLTAWADMEWAAFSAQNPGHLDAQLSAQVSREDVFRLADAYLPASLKSQYPEKMLIAEVELKGNLEHVDVKTFRVTVPGMIDAKVDGYAGNLLADGALSADLVWDIHTQDLSPVNRMMGLTGVNLPPVDMTGTTRIADEKYQADFSIRQGQGTARLKGTFNAKNSTYQAVADVRHLAVSRFLPMDSSFVLTARADVEGRGFDFFSRTSRLTARLDVPRFSYGHSHIGDLKADMSLKQGVGTLNFYSDGDIVNADGCVELTLHHHKVDSAAFALDVRSIDLYTLGVTQKPFRASMTMHMQGNSNLSDRHYAKGDISAIQFMLADTTFYPRDINLEAFLNPDTTYAFLSAGDLLFRMESPEAFSRLIDQSILLSDSLLQQAGEHRLDRNRLISMLPTVDFRIQSGQLNPLANILAKMSNITYRELDVDLHSHPVAGLRGNAHIYTTNTGAVVLDTITFALNQDSLGTYLDARVCNGKKNKDVTFDSRVHVSLCPDSAALGLLFFDENNRKGVDLGATVAFKQEGLRMQLTPLRPILAFRHFAVNEDNYVEVMKDGRLTANLDLVADDGTGLKFYSTPNEEAEQDLTVFLNRFNMGEICSVMPYMPYISGFLGGDVHYVKTQDMTSVMTDLTIEDMRYEGYPMGDISLNAAYMPNEDGSHFVDGLLLQDGRQILSFNGQYSDQGTTDHIDADVNLERFPVTMANAFMDETFQLAGYLHGKVNVTGSSAAPVVNGVIRNDSLHILSPLYSFNMAVKDDSIVVSDSRLSLDRLVGHTQKSSPFTLDGTIDFRDFSDITLNLNAKASNFELINAQRSRTAAAYGKVYIDLDVNVKGSISQLNVYGNLGVLGNTNVTYVLQDSPLTVEDEMSDLVTFCDFSDTLEVEEPNRPMPSNLRMNFNISIDQAAVVNCLLSEDGVSNVRLEGGGDLRMTYDDVRGMQLFGRYNILQGVMNYSLMLVTLKDCFIQNGSYVEFTGDVTNPRLHITATERVNSSVTENGTSRGVAFDVGLKVSQTLDNMGLEFTLEAPEDINVQNQIALMSAEQRGRVAVTLMTTGMYLVEGVESSGGFNTTNALNAFLQSQIANIAGKALGTIDLSLGVANNATGRGTTTTDYSFRFAKRFWGNRVSLIVGGKVSSGSDAVNTGQSIIDNVSIEYRLDKSATRYVTIFYDNNQESVLEGQVMEMGAGLVLRRKTNRLGELFIFRKQ